MSKKQDEIVEKDFIFFIEFMGLLAVAFCVITNCFRSTPIPICKGGEVITIPPQFWELAFGWLGIGLITAIAVFGYWKFL